MLVSVQTDWFIRSRRTAPMLARTDTVATIAENWLAQFDRALAAAVGAHAFAPYGFNRFVGKAD